MSKISDIKISVFQGYPRNFKGSKGIPVAESSVPPRSCVRLMNFNFPTQTKDGRVPVRVLRVYVHQTQKTNQFAWFY